jgi:hypothetical protein
MSWTDSWADRTYNSLNAFRFVNANGQSQLGRWSMEHTAPEHFVDHAALAKLGRIFSRKISSNASLTGRSLGGLS